MRARIEEWSHLGDKVAACLILDNVAKQAGEVIEVGGDYLIRDIIELFNTKRLKFSIEKQENKFLYSINDFFIKLEQNVSFFDSEMPFFKSQIIQCDFKALKLKDIELPFVQSHKERFTSFQFDSRSKSETKKRLGRKESLSFLKRHSRYAPVGVGGLDTKKELPYPYSLGGFKSVAETISKSSQFVGVDSGMSHLAGVMGIPSSIYIMFKQERDVRATESFYKTFYPNTKCFSDFSESGSRMPAFKIF